jgi:hypothetical protein
VILYIPTVGRPHHRDGAAALLGPAGFRSQKIPKNETEHGQNDDQNGPEYFSSRIRAALKDVDDCPHIGDQHDETEQALVLHFSSSLLLLAALRSAVIKPFANGNIVHFAQAG